MSEPARILVVDDTPMNVKLLEGVLTGHGFVVMTAPSGPAALERVRADRPDLVLLDVVMPEMSGYEVCRRLRADEATRLLPIIMVTALDPGTERVSSPGCGRCSGSRRCTTRWASSTGPSSGGSPSRWPSSSGSAACAASSRPSSRT